MRSRRMVHATAGFLLVCLSAATACSDDPAEPGGNGDTIPTLGDVSFSPEFANIGDARTADFSLRNESQTEISSLILGVDDASPTTDPGFVCTSITAGTAPPSVVSLEPGEQVLVRASFLTDDIDFSACSTGEYEADVVATTNNVVIGRATVRFDVHEEPLAFGDVDFMPAFENIGTARSTTLVLRNNAAYTVNPVEIELDGIAPAVEPDATCSSMTATASPAAFASLATGEERDVEITIDTSGTDCPAGQYDADFFVRVGQGAVGGATIRFDWIP